MNNYMFTVQYDGSRYNGWQRLTNQTDKTIQGKIEALLSRLLNENIEIIGSGRTDAGVHSYGQVANFRTTAAVEDNFIESFNRYLPEDIRILEFKKVDERFHARYNATEKTYLYRIDNSKFGDPFIRKYSYHVPEKLDIATMEKAASLFLGKKDFTSFSKTNKKKSGVREIFEIKISKSGDSIDIFFTADGFLYNMVRMLTGAIISAGLGKTSLEEIQLLLEDKSREQHRFVVPPQGLFLYSVKYR